MPFLRGGRLSLDLTWTVRYRAVLPTEILLADGDLARWIAGAIPELLIDVDAEALHEARALREAIYTAAVGRAKGDTVLDPASVAVVNAWAARERLIPQVDADGGRSWLAPDVMQVLAEIAVDAVEVLSLRDGRLKMCEGPHCALPFYDTTRAGSRRWCATARCGNRVNTKAYRERRGPSSTSPAGEGAQVGPAAE